MKKGLLSLAVFITSFLSAQNEDIDNLQSQIDANKLRIETLQNAVDAVTTENIYLKGVLDIQKPITEDTADNTTYKVVAVKGDRKNKNIMVEIMVESSDRNKYLINSKVDMIDVLGNYYPNEIFFGKSINAVQYKNVPLKISYGFHNVEDDPKFIKIFKLNASTAYEGEDYTKTYPTSIEFRDLPIDWQ